MRKWLFDNSYMLRIIKEICTIHVSVFKVMENVEGAMEKLWNFGSEIKNKP